MINETVGKRIKKWRKLKKMTQEKLLQTLKARIEKYREVKDNGQKIKNEKTR